MRGGETYKGIARNKNLNWKGWKIIDAEKKKADFPQSLNNSTNLSSEIEEFYKINYWDKIKGDQIEDESVAFSIFDFAVNAGVKTSIKLAQKVVKTKEDGVIGKISLKAINEMLPEEFLADFTLGKIVRYIRIVEAKPTTRKFFYGWIKRTMEQYL